MERSFPETLSALRKGRNISQRQAAAELGISQALLSHYENGAREPGLSFVCRACDYYGVTADYLLGRSAHPGDVSLRDAKQFLNELRARLERAESALQSAEGEES
ncbi:MAG: helix-turn-helix transcriptional regulator [Oscillospiraceae bacterium]|nr:helix-turn-helix transcriptional regulator [Oscillospiraceae bacterium]